MDNREKILLGNKDILSRKLEDFYLDINLSSDKREIITQKYDNVFDVNKFYEKERNSSRDFIIYGSIDSYTFDCNNMIINVYQSKDFTEDNFLCQSITKNIVNEHIQLKNIYGKVKGKYIIDNIPSNFTGFSVYLKIDLPNGNMFLIEQQLIFTTLTMTFSGDKVVEILPYGLNDAIVTCDGDIVEVNNDFDFFYNKHWINLNIGVQDLTTEWIPDENSIYCETYSNPIFHGRIVQGTFFTGNYAFERVMEVYRTNGLPTGNVEENVQSSLHYSEPIPSGGECVAPRIFNLSVDKLCLPADGNSAYTSVDNWNYYDVMNITPTNPIAGELPTYDTQIMETEIVSGENISNDTINNFWKFSHFQSIGNFAENFGQSFSMAMNKDLTIQGVYKENCPYSLYVEPIAVNTDVISSSNLFKTSVFDYNGNELINKKTNFLKDEIVKISILSQDHYINNINTTGSGIVQVANRYSYLSVFDIKMIKNTFVKLYYKKYKNLKIVSINQTATANGITGRVKIDSVSPSVPIVQSMITASTITQEGMISGGEETIKTFYGTYIDVTSSATMHPPENPRVSAVTNYVNVGLWLDLNGDGSEEYFAPYDEYPGIWTWSGVVSGAGTTQNIQNQMISFYMTGDTYLKIVWKFNPYQYIPNIPN